MVDRGDLPSAVQHVLDAQVVDPDDLADTLVRAAEWPDSESFEAHRSDVLLSGRHGRFWLSPSMPRRTLLPLAPVIVPRHLKALAGAILGGS